MANRKAVITLGVGILSILSSVFVLIMMGLTEGVCNLKESCVYVPSEPLWIFSIGLLTVGVVLTLIGFICGGAKDDDALSESDEK